MRPFVIIKAFISVQESKRATKKHVKNDSFVYFPSMYSFRFTWNIIDYWMHWHMCWKVHIPVSLLNTYFLENRSTELINVIFTVSYYQIYFYILLLFNNLGEFDVRVAFTNIKNKFFAYYFQKDYESMLDHSKIIVFLFRFLLLFAIL